MKLPKYVQAWVDNRDGRAYYYLRRRGFPRVPLPGLPWSPSFMAAYEAALAGPRAAIGAGRIKPGSVSAVVAEFFDSHQFFALKSAGTQRMRRGILERFRAAYGDRPLALLPPEWIEALLDSKPPHAARSWLVTVRSLFTTFLALASAVSFSSALPLACSRQRPDDFVTGVGHVIQCPRHRIAGRVAPIAELLAEGVPPSGLPVAVRARGAGAAHRLHAGASGSLRSSRRWLGRERGAAWRQRNRFQKSRGGGSALCAQDD